MTQIVDAKRLDLASHEEPEAAEIAAEQTLEWSAGDKNVIRQRDGDLRILPVCWHERRRLLLEEPVSLLEAGDQMGFENLGHFKKMFERHTGKKL